MKSNNFATYEQIGAETGRAGAEAGPAALPKSRQNLPSCRSAELRQLQFLLPLPALIA